LLPRRILPQRASARLHQPQTRPEKEPLPPILLLDVTER
jgi:hypothetical protein